MKAQRGRLDIESTVDWELMPVAVATLSLEGYQGQRVDASLDGIIQEARQLVAHYRKAGKSLPDIMAAPV